MADREKTIKGLEAHATASGCMKNCPYWRIEALNCSQELAADALALLEAQQPRVLTLEEVKASKGKDLILEYSPWKYGGRIVAAVTIEGCGSRGVSFALSVACDYTAYNRKHSFGWRCWSARPTDEQRKAVEWDD